MAFGDSKTSIINLALTHLGSKSVNDQTNEGPQYAALSKLYDVVQNCCLMDWEWSFAIKSIRLSRVETDSNYPGFKYTYMLPTNPNPLVPTEERLMVRAIMTETNGVASQALATQDYALTADTVYTNQKCPTFCLYIFNQQESKYSSSFVLYLSYFLAMTGCMIITQSSEKLKELMSLVEMAKNQAIQNDKIQSPSIIIQKDFTATRFGRFGGLGQNFLAGG